MVYIKKIAVFSALSVCVAMYGGPDDEWITVGPRKKVITTLPSAKILPKKPAACPSKPKAPAAPSAPAIMHKPIQKVVAAPSKPNFVDMRLHFAALNDDVTKINDLIMTEHVHIDAQDARGATALHWAATNEKTASIKALLSYEDGIACIGIQDDNLKTPLHLAAGRAPSAMLALLEKAPQEYIDLEDKDGSTALLWATSAGKLETVKALVKKGADINAQDAVRGRTALHWALRMRKGATEKGGQLMAPKTSQAIIKYLVEHNADTTVKDNDGYTAFYWAKQLNLRNEMALLNNMPIDVRRSERIRKRAYHPPICRAD